MSCSHCGEHCWHGGKYMQNINIGKSGIQVPFLGTTCLGMALTQKLVYKEIYYSMAVCLGLICYEVIGLTFDYKDIIATFIGALLSYAINKMVIRYSC